MTQSPIDFVYILIFDPKYNYLNMYNTNDFNGAVFNGLIPASYMLRRRAYRERDRISETPTISFSENDACYHLFLSLYHQFSWIPIPSNKQWIHAYPGGGLFSKKDLQGLPSDVGIVITQVTTLNWISELQLSNDFVMALGGSYLQKDTKLIPKTTLQVKKLEYALLKCRVIRCIRGMTCFPRLYIGFQKTIPSFKTKP